MELESRGVSPTEELTQLIAPDKKEVVFRRGGNGYFLRSDGHPYIPTQQQEAFIKSKARFCLFRGGRGSGKALSIQTPILTWNRGWVTMEDVHIGDYVFDENGIPREVISTSEIQHGHDCFLVSFNDGSSLVADAEHLWYTETKKDRIANRLGTIKTTSDLAGSVYIGTKKELRHSIPRCKPLQYKEKELPIDPYYLGYWLGDGNSKDSRITTADESVIDELISRGFECVKNTQEFLWSVKIPNTESTRNRNSGRMEANPNNLTTKLKSMSLLHNKHVPEEYKTASVEQRLDLICGLMDSDGYADKLGHCEFTVTSKHLAEDMLELLRSVGVKATLVESDAKLKGLFISKRYRIYINSYVPLFKLPRKLSRQLDGFPKTQKHRRERIFIKSVTKINSVPVKCIAIDSPSHLYLAGKELIPTHNSAAGSQKAMEKISQGLDGAVINPIFSDFKTSTWPEFKEWIDWSMVVPSQRHRKSDAWQPHQPFTMVFLNGAKVYCKGLKDPKSARGANINWLWYDEAASDDSGLSWKIAVASVRVGKDPQAWATTTPKGKEHWVYKFFIDREIPQEAVDLLSNDGRILIETFRGSITDNKSNVDAGFYASIVSAFPSGWLRAQEVDGDFAEEGGKVGDRRWFDGKVRDEAPEVVNKRVRFWDLAATEKKQATDDPDEAVGTLASKYTDDRKTKYCIEHQVAGYWAWEKLLEAIANTARHDGPNVEVVLEEEPGSGGKNQVAAVAKYFKDTEDLKYHKVIGQRARDVGDRVMAANHWFGLAADGMVEIVKGSWNEKFLSQLDGFTQLLHDDRVTSVTGAITRLNPFKTWAKSTFMTLNGKKKVEENNAVS